MSTIKRVFPAAKYKGLSGASILSGHFLLGAVKRYPEPWHRANGLWQQQLTVTELREETRTRSTNAGWVFCSSTHQHYAYQGKHRGWISTKSPTTVIRGSPPGQINTTQQGTTRTTIRPSPKLEATSCTVLKGHAALETWRTISPRWWLVRGRWRSTFQNSTGNCALCYSVRCRHT